MHLVLNAQLLALTNNFRSAGISRYIYWLLRELNRDSRGHEFDIFLPDVGDSTELMSNRKLRYHETGRHTQRPVGRIVWEQLAYPLLIERLRPNLVHNLAFASPALSTRPTVLTVLDLSFIRFPDTFNLSNRLYLLTITRLSARRARRVLTISEAAKDDLVRLLGVAPSRIDVTYPGVDAHYRELPAQEVRAFRLARQLPPTFIFYLGTIQPRKNLLGLLEAYAMLPSKRPPLYVAGGTGWRYTSIFEHVNRLALASDVTFLGYVPEQDLPYWYNSATIFVFPSLYEGFGLPVLEAMACGTPVVTSNTSSFPELVGDAARTVDPRDHRRLAEEMRALVEDPAARSSLRAAGPKRSALFTWKGMADQTVRSYEQALAR